MVTLVTLEPLSGKQRVRLHEELQRFQGPTQAVLKMVVEATAPVTSAAIREATGLSPSHIATILDRLRKQMLVEKAGRGMHQRHTLTFGRLPSGFRLDATRTW